MASLSLPSSSCSAGVYVDVGMDRSNKDVYDVLDAYSQTKMPQGTHKVGGIATEAPGINDNGSYIGMSFFSTGI